MTSAVDIWAVVPFKGFDQAKQRLRGTYAPPVRRALARAMFDDVLDTLAAVPELAGIMLVTPDREAATLAAARGIRVFSETAPMGLTSAVMAAAARLAAEGAAGMLIVPCDVPGAVPHEISHLLATHRQGRGFTIVPSHDRRGTNAIVVTPPDAVALAFGPDSFALHLAAARRAGIIANVVSLPGLSLDIDTPGDCLTFLRGQTGGRTWSCLAEQANAGSDPRQTERENSHHG